MKTAEEVIAAARADLRAYGLYCTAPVQIDWQNKHTQGCVGICYPEKPAMVWVSPLLSGTALYRVVLHELGHVLGLNDRRSGIMAYKRYQPVDWMITPPTKAQRKAWSFEIAQEVLQLRRKQWKAA